MPKAEQWSIPDGEWGDLLLATGGRDEEVVAILEEWYPELIGSSWTITRTGTITINGNRGPEGLAELQAALPMLGG